MTSEDRPAFAAALYMLGEVHRTDVSSDLAEVYFDALTDYALSEVLNAIRRKHSEGSGGMTTLGNGKRSTQP